jgi:hypothetical protein
VTAVDDNGRLCIVIACYQTKLISIYSLFWTQYHGNRWKQKIAEGNNVVVRIIIMVTGGSSVNFLFIVYLLKYVMISTREE